MFTLKNVPAVVAGLGLVVTCVGTALTSQGAAYLGEPIWAVGGVLMLAGLLAFLAAKISARTSLPGRWAGPTSALNRPGTLISAAQFTAVVLVVLGVLFVGGAVFQAINAIRGWGQPWMAAYPLASGLSTLALGLGLWLIAKIACQMELLLRKAAVGEDPARENRANELPSE